MRRTSEKWGLLISEINDLRPKLIGQQQHMEALLQKYEAEENYELCALVLVYFGHMNEILAATEGMGTEP